MRLIKTLTLAMLLVLQSLYGLGRILLGHDLNVLGRQTVALRCHFRRHGHSVHDGLLPAPNGALKKATSEEMALFLEKSMSAPVRRMIENKNERKQDEIRAQRDWSAHCRSSKYFSAAATIQHCASNFSSFDSS
nr:MAG TPA: hypothetical protein [Caudoviricetes sp.]